MNVAGSNFNVGPIKATEFLWRSNHTLDGMTKTANAGISGVDQVSLSSEAGLAAKLRNAETAEPLLGHGKTADLLTDSEKMTLRKMSEHYDGQQDDQVGKLGLALALDKIMARHSGTEQPKLDTDYLKLILARQGAPGSIYAKIEGDFIANLAADFSKIAA